MGVVTTSMFTPGGDNEIGEIDGLAHKNCALSLGDGELFDTKIVWYSSIFALVNEYAMLYNQQKPSVSREARRDLVIWSKLKKTVEALMADSVKEHLQLHFAQYGPGESFTKNRVWLAWDKQEICTFSTIRWMRTRRLLASQIGGDSGPGIQYEYFAQAEALLAQEGDYPVERFLAALESYVSLSIEQALISPDALIRAWSMLDRRVGKRRLLAMHFAPDASELERRWYQLRCKVENIGAMQVS